MFPGLPTFLLLGVEGNYVWCLVIVVKFMGLVGAKSLSRLKPSYETSKPQLGVAFYWRR